MTVNNSKTLSTDIKTSNASLILRIIRENAPISRADLARITGMTRSTVSALVGSLIELGFLLEVGLNNMGGVGKRATLLDVRTDRLFAVAIRFSYNSAYLAKVDLRGRLHDQTKQSLARGTKEVVLEKLLETTRQYIKRMTENGEICNGIGIAVPSPLKNGVMAYASSLHSLEGVNLHDVFSGEFNMEVYVNNDADAAALAEIWFGGYPAGTNLAFILLHQGIGCGMMRDKELYVGGLQRSNEFGHTRVESGGPVCFCGKTGCLVAFASDWSMYERLPESMRKTIKKDTSKGTFNTNLEKMLAHICQHPGVYSDYTEFAAKYLGIGLANLVGVYTPDVIVVEGAVLDIPDFLETAVKSCAENIHPMFEGTYAIGRSQLESNPSLVGAGTFMIRDMYADPFRVWNHSK